MKERVSILSGAVGTVVCNLFGGWSPQLQVLLIFMALDYILGVLNALVFGNSEKSENGKLNSRVGFQGIYKKVLMLCLVIIGSQVDYAFNMSFAQVGIVTALIVNELISILETYKSSGLKYPKILDKIIDSISNEEGA